MNITQRDLIMQRWGVVQRELSPDLGSEIGPLTSKLEKESTRWCRNRRDKLMIWACAPAEIDVRGEAITPNRNTVHLRPVRPELVEGPSYAARLRQVQPERIKLAK